MKNLFINDVHNYINLDTTEEENNSIPEPSIPEPNPQVIQINENIDASTNRNEDED